jgi:hypothetical protein
MDSELYNLQNSMFCIISYMFRFIPKQKMSVQYITISHICF